MNACLILYEVCLVIRKKKALDELDFAIRIKSTLNEAGNVWKWFCIMTDRQTCKVRKFIRSKMGLVV